MRWQIAAALAALTLCGCAATEHRYAGSPGSVYDKERDPPGVIGKGSYDPTTPIREHDYGNGGSPAPAAAPATPPAR